MEDYENMNPSCPEDSLMVDSLTLGAWKRHELFMDGINHLASNRVLSFVFMGKL